MAFDVGTGFEGSVADRGGRTEERKDRIRAGCELWNWHC
jgi:hypothetical protein